MSSCPDWRPLLAHRFDPTVAEPPDWQAAEAHLSDCPACRRKAAAIDPTLVFQDAARWTPAASESAEIRRAVRTLRRASDVERRAGAGKRSAPAGGRVVGARDRGPLVAAALFAVVLALQPASLSRKTISEPAANDYGQLRRAARPQAPAIEGVDRPEARVYEWGADDLSVVMVVDESLDV